MFTQAYTVRKICKFYGSLRRKFVRVTSVILIYGESAYIGYWRMRSSAHSSTRGRTLGWTPVLSLSVVVVVITKTHAVSGIYRFKEYICLMEFFEICIIYERCRCAFIMRFAIAINVYIFL